MRIRQLHLFSIPAGASAGKNIRALQPGLLAREYKVVGGEPTPTPATTVGQQAGTGGTEGVQLALDTL